MLLDLQDVRNLIADRGRGRVEILFVADVFMY